MSPSEYVQDLATELRAAKATILRQAETIASACVAAGVSRTADLPGAVLDLDRQRLDWAERASRAERERGEYQAQVHDLAEDLRQADEIRAAVHGAATEASGDMVTALDRIRELQEVVDAAVFWQEARRAPDTDAKFVRSCNLARLVDAHIARVKARS